MYFYRGMENNENIKIGNEDMPNQQQMPNEDKIKTKQQSQTEPDWMPFTNYPMMNGMYDPATYDSQIPQQEYQTTQETDQYMERAPYNHNHNHGNENDHNHDYDHGYNEGYKDRKSVV